MCPLIKPRLSLNPHAFQLPTNLFSCSIKMHSETESYYFSHELHMNLYSLTTLFLLPAFLYAGPSCPAGFSMLNQNKCIKVYTSSAKRSDATTQCTSLGGTLVTIKNAIVSLSQSSCIRVLCSYSRTIVQFPQ